MQILGPDGVVRQGPVGTTRADGRQIEIIERLCRLEQQGQKLRGVEALLASRFRFAQPNQQVFATPIALGGENDFFDRPGGRARARVKADIAGMAITQPDPLVLADGRVFDFADHQLQGDRVERIG